MVEALSREVFQRLRYPARLITAFCVAPLPAALLETWIIDGNTSVFLIISGLLYAMQLAIGLPGYWMLFYYEQPGFAPHVLVGFASVAGSVFLLSLRYCTGDACVTDTLYHSVSFGLLGLLMGAIFWLIARPRVLAPRS